MTSLFDSLSINSFVTYEILGEFDLLLRLWVPQAVDPHELSLKLDTNLGGLHLFEAQFMVATDIDRHHPWQSDSVGIPNGGPDPSVLARITDTHINAINTFNDRQIAAHEAHRRDDAQTRFTASYKPISPPTWVAEFEASHALRSIDIDRHGIRFFVMFDHPHQPVRAKTRDEVKRKIRECYERVLETTIARHGLDDPPEISFYSGYGPMTDFLILARAPDGHFYSFMRSLVFGLRETGIDEIWGFRPYTFAFADRSFSALRELPISIRPTVRDIDELLLQEESRTLEFKATYLTDFHRFLNTGEKHRNSKMIDSIVRTVCGFLNSEDGGDLVVGVGEVDRLAERVSGGLDRLRDLSADFSIVPPPDDEGRIPSGAKLIVGQEFERDTESAVRDLDAYRQHLEAVLRDRISPNPLAFVELDSTEFADRAISIVRVRPSSERWHYATVEGRESAFFVREATSTRAYEGEDRELYQRSHPRRGGFG